MHDTKLHSEGMEDTRFWSDNRCPARQKTARYLGAKDDALLEELASQRYNPSLNEPLNMWHTAIQCGVRPAMTFCEAWEAQQKFEEQQRAEMVARYPNGIIEIGEEQEKVIDSLRKQWDTDLENSISNINIPKV